MSLLDIFSGELLGTLVLILLGNGVVANVVFNGTKGTKSGWIVITMGWGMAVFAGICVADIFHTGGHLNPAVTFANWVNGSIVSDQAIVYICSQFLGACIAQLLVNTIYWKHLIESDSASVLGMHATTPTHQNAYINNFVTEFIATSVLIVVAMFALSTGSGREILMEPILGALAVGLTVLAIGLSLGGTTGYAINPARDLIPRLVYCVMYKTSAKSLKNGNSNWKYAWNPVIAPITAGIILGAFFRLK